MNSKSFKNGLKAFAALFTILLVAGATFAFTGSKNHSVLKAAKKPAGSLYWYAVNPSTNKTTAAYSFHDTKSNVISAQGCNDTGTPICLYGSNSSSVAVGTNVGTPSAPDRINQTAP